ncbi:FemAB family XrtA/PEP-CTERM system-associated protein [Marinimicrobium sp. ABcell2]|uniref:FemAB family XrtA/PEP-CTERM system-associated protein n=1 Tax=Marinimicrobium sp. ABcell2 TaxID=3069751 RepID=UPI0027B73FF3|nr:FemAB family XrtA/PEP-CTERM system-associated protein [Marinimicrobium sp. ABcell2]MDQ2076162.1 FemAB family PEP-CTERM system-associated protein [Marinimicrobium sp. ABcell2]
MDIKAFVRDPQAALKEMGLDLKEELGSELMTQAQIIKDERQRLKALKADKAEVARAFKSVADGTSEHAELIERMQSVSRSVKALESELKKREKYLRAALPSEQQPESKPKLPPLYQIPNSDYASAFQIFELDAEQMDRWYQFVKAQKDAPAYCFPAWREAIQSVFGHQTRVWVAQSEAGDIVGGVPLTFFNSRLFGRFAVSVPYFNYGGVLTPYTDVARALLKELEQVCAQEELDHIEVRTMQPELWPHKSSKKVSMVLPLPKSSQRLDEQLGAKVRAQCKKAEPYNPEIRFGATDLLDDFYRVFAINMRDLGTPVYTKKWFSELLTQPDIEATLAVVYVGNKPVSAGFLVGHNGMLEIPWASTVRSANAMDTNMWMYRQILDFAVRNGYEFFDFGRSTRDAGTYRFKKQWGAQPFEHHWYYILPAGGSMPGLNPDNPKYKFLIAAWKRLPVWITKLVGPPLVKNIP